MLTFHFFTPVAVTLRVQARVVENLYVQPDCRLLTQVTCTMILWTTLMMRTIQMSRAAMSGRQMTSFMSRALYQTAEMVPVLGGAAPKLRLGPPKTTHCSCTSSSSTSCECPFVVPMHACCPGSPAHVQLRAAVHAALCAGGLRWGA